MTVGGSAEGRGVVAAANYEARISDMEEVLRAWLVELVVQVAWRLGRHDIKARAVELKARFADLQTISRSLTLTEPTNIRQELLAAGVELLTKRLPFASEAS